MTFEPPPGPLVLQPGDTRGHPLAPWFEHFRERRREHYAARGPRARPARSALLTIVQNESVFLPIWLGYYSRFFAPEDIYMLDHDTTDGSTDRSGFVRIPVSHDTFDNTWIVSTVERHQQELLTSYDVVVVVDVDEIIAPDPAHGTLGDYLARFDEEWVNCLGYEVLHMRDREPAIDLDRPVLDQRRYWFPNSGYDKPAIATTAIKWKPGFHGRVDRHMNLDPDLRLIHLHRMDYEICLARHRRWTAREWNRLDLDAGWGTHNRVTEDEEFAHWFYSDSAFDGVPITPEPIDQRWRGIV